MSTEVKKATEKDWSDWEKSRRTVYLNGKLVQPEEIDPAKHKYIGRFRPAYNPITDPQSDVLCRCGEILRYVGEEREHYNRGCYDVNQYVDIDQEETNGQCAGCGAIYPNPHEPGCR